MSRSARRSDSVVITVELAAGAARGMIEIDESTDEWNASDVRAWFYVVDSSFSCGFGSCPADPAPARGLAVRVTRVTV